MSGKIRSGWEFVRADEYPDTDFPVVDTGKYAGIIGVGGLVLARISEELAQSREAYFSNKCERNEGCRKRCLKGTASKYADQSRSTDSCNFWWLKEIIFELLI